MTRLRHKAFIGAGVVLILLAVAWGPLAAPRLVRFPTDVDETLHYEGTITVNVDESGTPLASPLVAPVEITRVLRSTGDQSFGRARLIETITTKFAGTSQVERHGYVLDRRSMSFVDDAGNWSYFPDHRADRAGLYRVNLPTDVSPSAAYRIWNNETGAAYQAIGSGRREKLGGLDVIRYAGQMEPTAVSAGFIRQQGFPSSVGIEALAGELAAAGLDLAAVNALLASALNAEDAAAFAAELAEPISLDYEFYFIGSIAVEPETGAIVALEGVTEGIQVRPDLSGFEALRPRLTKYQGNPVIGAIDGVLAGLLQRGAQPVFQLRHAQTPDSVAEMVDEARTSRDQKRLVEERAPQVLMATGALVYVLGLVLVVRAHRRGPSPSAVVELPAPAEEQPSHRAAS
jgi:hypothetical protein